MSSLTASAEVGDLIEVQAYTVEMNVREDRWVEVTEHITVKFLSSGLTMFYRSLPTDGCRYQGITATCNGNASFHYEVADNPDMLGFIDVNCIGGAEYGKTWTYVISYAMQQGVENENGMIIDVVGFGWSVPLHNVGVTVNFPSAVKSNNLNVYVGGYGSNSQSTYNLSLDGKTLFIKANRLNLVYNDTYYERMAEGITVDFTLDEGVLQSYADTRMFTEDIGKLIWAASFCICIGLVIWLCKPKREIISVVSIKPPEGMSPIQMGKILDGTVDDEDITSMVYYFAHKGYLKIDFTKTEDPQLIRMVRELPSDAPAHEKTLFDGLFKGGKFRMVKAGDGTSKEIFTVYVSELAGTFYETTQLVKTQMLTPPMYDKKTLLLYGVGQLLGWVFAMLATFLMGRKLGGGYNYGLGVLFLAPLLINLFIGVVRENYRFKWKETKRRWVLLIEYVIIGLFSLLFIFFLAEHIMTEWEKLVLCIGAFVPAILTQETLVRTERYGKTLGQVLGFKEFIVATEEDKIAYMLDENPELYYEVLPYAQVLGVTDEWEKKFEKLTLQPPTWYEGRASIFDYIVLNQCFRAAMLHAMADAAKLAQGGGHIGRSGGGGGFGGFGGGGFGGGGGGAR